MKKSLDIVLVVLVIILSSSCISAKRCSRKFPSSEHRNDSASIIVRERIHDTAIMIPADSSWLEMLMECNEKGEILLKQLLDSKQGARAFLPVVSVKDNVLTVDCKVDSAYIYALFKSRDTTISRLTSIQNTVRIPVNHLTWWQRTQIILFRILATIVFIIIAYHLLKKSLL